MLRTLGVLLVGLILVGMFSTGSFAEDAVRLKNGSTYRGKIVQVVPGQSVTLQDRAGNTHVLPFDDIALIESGLRGQGPGKKSGAVSFLLSFLVFPGVGQFYNGEPGKGVAMVGIGVTAFAMIVGSDDEDVNGVGALILLGNWVWSSVDAPLSSGRINREFGYTEVPRSETGPRLVLARVQF